MPELDDFVQPSLIPAPAPLTGEDEMAVAEASLEDDPDVEDVDLLVPFGRSWLFDFEAGSFVTQGGDPVRLREGMDALRMWILMALNVPRFGSVIHSDEFGVEHSDELIGSPVDPLTKTLFVEAVRDALLVHDRITEVDDFEFEVDDDGETLLASFVVLTDTDESVLIDSLSLP